MADKKRFADPESVRLRKAARREADWKRWGTYLPDRQWGTVREDYSATGDSWGSFSHEDAVSRVFRWGEDGLLGWSDRKARLNFSIALWNGKDPILKERLFGLTNPEGNHGEDVKELYYHLDATPTHSYCKARYKYPLDEFPYQQIRDENRNRGHHDREFELLDTPVFAENRYMDVEVEYAKGGPDDVLIHIGIMNRSAETEDITLLGQLVCRNTWAWGCEHEGCTPKPSMALDDGHVKISHPSLGEFAYVAEDSAGWLFTDNESNLKKLFNIENRAAFTKDAFHRQVVDGEDGAVNPEHVGTKCAALHTLRLQAGETKVLRFRLSPTSEKNSNPLGSAFTEILQSRRDEADMFYRDNFKDFKDEDARLIHRRAMAGMLWNKQFYHYSVYDWIKGDPNVAVPPRGRGDIRNGNWEHVFSRDVLSMPDKWEYPWFAVWDTAFHMIPFADIDPWFARDQLMLFLREWYMHPNGQIPAYEFNFNDVNPPVHAWACREVYRRLKDQGETDLDFLEQSFHKLLINFTWWVNRKDPEGKNIFSGGFLGLDNIGAFDRSHPPPGVTALEQADGTAWMAFYCATMLDMALELARHRPVYDGIASKFFEHFMNIADAMNNLGGVGLWEEEDGFYHDHLEINGRKIDMRIRSMVGLLPLAAVLIIDGETLDALPAFKKRSQWFVDYRKDILHTLCWDNELGKPNEHLLAIPSRERLEKILRKMFDEDEFLSPFGIRSLSKYHEQNPFELRVGGRVHRVAYLPGESDSGMFGGNSNWRGPIWFPVNFLLIESLNIYGRFYGDDLKVEFPTGSGTHLTLEQTADQLAHRLSGLFRKTDHGRPCHGGEAFYDSHRENQDLLLFYEYFDPETGRGCGASHQTGWTGLMASLLEPPSSDEAGRQKLGVVNSIPNR